MENLIESYLAAAEAGDEKQRAAVVKVALEKILAQGTPKLDITPLILMDSIVSTETPERLSLPEILNLCRTRTPIGEFANAIVRYGAEFDLKNIKLKNCFEGLSEALRYYKAARDLNPEDPSLSGNCIDTLINLKWYAKRENKPAGVIKQIEDNLAQAQKYHRERFNVDYQTPSFLT